MLKLHATKKLFAKLPLDDGRSLPASKAYPIAESGSELLGDWTANLITVERRQCLLFVHHQTRFPVFIPAVRKPELKKLEYLFADVFLNTLLKLGLSQEVFERTADLIGGFHIDTKTDRSTLGTMNQFKLSLEFMCQQYDLDEATGYSISRDLALLLCKQPSKQDYIVPAVEMALLLGESEEVAHRMERDMSTSLGTDIPDDIYYLVIKHYLERHATDNGMSSLPELHGFLTGVLLCQRTIMPSEWMPAVWGGKEHVPQWPSIEQVTQFDKSLMCIYNEIAGELVTDIDSFKPLFARYHERGQRDYSTPWCFGFMAGFALDKTYEFLPHQAHVAIAILSLPFDPEFEKDFDADGDIIDEHCEQVVPALKVLYSFTRSADGQSMKSNVVPFVRESKVGRNEFCPCGSGKKYKKCCLLGSE